MTDELTGLGLKDGDVNELLTQADMTMKEADALIAKARSGGTLPKALLDEVEDAVANKKTLSPQMIKHIRDQLRAAERLRDAMKVKQFDLYKRQAEIFEKWPIFVIMNGSHRVHPL